MVSVPSQNVDRRHYSRVLGVQASLTPVVQRPAATAAAAADAAADESLKLAMQLQQQELQWAQSPHGQAHGAAPMDDLEQESLALAMRLQAEEDGTDMTY